MEITQGKSPAYRKMHVVGPRQAIALDEISTQQRDAKAMRDYNPTVNAMVEAQSNIKDILEKATSDTPSKSRKRKAGGKPKVGASTSLSLYNACMERLHALKSQFDSSYEPLLQLMMEHNVAQTPVADGAVAPPAPAAPAAPAVVAAPGGLPPAPAAALPAGAQIALMGTPLRPATIPSTVGTSTQYMDIPESLGSLPKIYHERYKDLRSYMTKDPYAFKLAPKGQVVFKGNVLPGSSFNDLVRGLYVTSRGGKKPTATGMTEFLEALNTVGVPNTLLSAMTARSQYAGIQAASRIDKPSTSAPSSEKKKVKEQIADQKVQVHFLPPKVQTGKRSSSLPKTAVQQTGKGNTVGFPGKPVKCLRLY
jgi:hypothetical protein